MTKPKKLHQKLPKNFEYNGIVFSKFQIKFYNRLVNEINSYLKLGQDAPEKLLIEKSDYFDFLIRE